MLRFFAAFIIAVNANACFFMIFRYAILCCRCPLLRHLAAYFAMLIAYADIFFFFFRYYFLCRYAADTMSRFMPRLFHLILMSPVFAHNIRHYRWLSLTLAFPLISATPLMSPFFFASFIRYAD